MTRGAAVFVLVAALVGGLTGGLVGAAVVARFSADTRPAAATGSDDIAAAAAAVSPAVVTVVVTRAGVDAWGSGIVVDKVKGTIITNSHVVEIAGPSKADLTILLSDGRTLGATLLGSDPRTDLAVLRADGALPAQADLATTEPTVGARVIAIGTPGTQLATNALATTVTVGIVSAIGRRVPRADDKNLVLSDMIQTDASIGDGMSGGPLVLVSSKQVIGVSTSFIRGQMDLGFAVSAATVRRVLAEILAKAAP